MVLFVTHELRREWAFFLLPDHSWGFFVAIYDHFSLATDSDYGKIHIHVVGDDNNALHVADGEIIAIHWFPEFLRIHFMIGSVRDMDSAVRVRWEGEYLLTE